jgi:hypothetical protein
MNIAVPSPIGLLREFVGRWHREAGQLRDFETDTRHQAALYGPLQRRSMGVRTIEVHRIVGSVGRSHDFDASYQPRNRSPAARDRFDRVLKHMRAGNGVPAIDVYKLRRYYYVLDGHHRVGAAKIIGMKEIEANVTVFVPSGDTDEIQLYHERQAFERETRLTAIGAARPQTYRRLLTEIHDYRRNLITGEIDLQTAATRWYNNIFLPLFTRLQEADIQPLLPSLRHADMVAVLLEEARHATRRDESS